MNAETQERLESFSAFTAKIAYNGFQTHGQALSTSQYTQLLLDHKPVLLSTYGEELICFSSPHLLKRHTKGVQRITPQLGLDLGSDFLVPDYFTLLNETGDPYRIEVSVATFEQFEIHNRLVKQKADEGYARYQDLERTRLLLLSYVNRNKKARVIDAIHALYQHVAEPEPEPA